MGQFVQTFNPSVPGVPLTNAMLSLTDTEQRLFARLLPVDQRHSLRLFEAARSAHPDDPVLGVAALLHDVGKGRPGRLDRVMLTLLEYIAPWFLIRWRNRRWGLRGQLARLATHTAASAAFAHLAGSNTDVVTTLRAYGHRDHQRGKRLAELDSRL